MARIGIIGSEGRMGRALSDAIAAAGEVLSGGIDKGGDPLALARVSDVLVDFSSPHAVEANLDAAAAAGIPIVIGTSRLGEDWDIEIVETHHRMKVDAPSGTALLLGEAAAEGRGVKLAEVAQRGRDGITGARKAGDIGFAALRGGSVAGDHSVHFLADNERLTFSHLAENRGIFARGAIRAAQWLIGRPAGRYTMPEVLGL